MATKRTIDQATKILKKTIRIRNTKGQAAAISYAKRLKDVTLVKERGADFVKVVISYKLPKINNRYSIVGIIEK